jgi:lipopolysaccharide transport system permease protein
MNTDLKEDWDLVLEPKTNLFDLKLKEVWRYRDLLMLLVRRDIVSFYKQTILGPLWFFIQPIFTTIVFVYIFGNLAGISTDGLPSPLFYMVGITAWNYFAECLNKTSTVFRDNAHIFGKVYFPRIVMPISIVISNLMRFGIQVLLVMVVYGNARTWFWNAGIRNDDEISRFDFLTDFWHSIADVCHYGDLPLI